MSEYATRCFRILVHQRPTMFCFSLHALLVFSKITRRFSNPFVYKLNFFFCSSILLTVSAWNTNIYLLKPVVTIFQYYTRREGDLLPVEIALAVCLENYAFSMKTLVFWRETFGNGFRPHFLPHFDVICDLLPNRRTATWNLFVKWTMKNCGQFITC